MILKKEIIGYIFLSYLTKKIKYKIEQNFKNLDRGIETQAHL